jgi:hypothetical protein
MKAIARYTEKPVEITTSENWYECGMSYRENPIGLWMRYDYRLGLFFCSAHSQGNRVINTDDVLVARIALDADRNGFEMIQFSPTHPEMTADRVEKLVIRLTGLQQFTANCDLFKPKHPIVLLVDGRIYQGDWIQKWVSPDLVWKDGTRIEWYHLPSSCTPYHARYKPTQLERQRKSHKPMVSKKFTFNRF